MAWQIEKVGTAAQVNSAISAMTATNHTGQTAQLARVQPVILAEVAAVGTAKVRVVASGHMDAQASVINIRVEPATLGPNGEVFVPPNAPK